MKKVLLVLLFVILLGFVVLGIYLFNQEENVPQEDLNTYNWKAYNNEEFGYSFKYPNKFSITQPLAQGYEGGNILVDPDSSYLTIYVVTTPHPELKEGSKDLVINGYNAKLTPPSGEYKTGINIYKNESLIVIYLRNVDNKRDQNDEDLFMKIVSTIELSN